MDLLHRYASSLKKAKSFFEGKKKTPKGTPITQSQLLKLYQNRADCPICGTEFSGTNNNTEHIHPRALGGTNEATNKIQMCKLCNNCRNVAMQHHLIGPPYSKSYPSMWEQIQRFVMWSEITIDDGLEAGEVFPEIHQTFMDERFAGLTPPKGPSRAFGRASTIDAATVPNYAQNRTLQSRSPPATIRNPASKKKGIWQTVFTPLLDWASGYKNETNTNLNGKNLPKKPSVKPASKPNNLPTEEKKNQSNEVKYRPRDYDIQPLEEGYRVRRNIHKLNFEQILAMTLSTFSLPLSRLAHWISLDLKAANVLSENDHYLSHFGFSKKKGLRAAIDEQYSASVCLQQEDGVWYAESLGAGYLRRWSNIIAAAHKGGTPLQVAEFWTTVNAERKQEGKTWTEFLSPLAIKAKGPVYMKVCAILDRTQLCYTIKERSGHHYIDLITAQDQNSNNTEEE